MLLFIKCKHSLEKSRQIVYVNQLEWLSLNKYKNNCTHLSGTSLYEETRAVLYTTE